MPNMYPKEFQLKVVHRYEDGTSIPDLCEEFHIATSTAYHWIKTHRTIQTPQRTYTPFEFDALVHRLKKVEHEMEIIRLTHYFERIPLQEKLETLAWLHSQFEEYSVHELCEALDVSRGTFYNHIFRRADRSKYEDEQAQLMKLVQQVFDDSGLRYGAEKVWAVLAENGIRTDSKKEFKKRQKYAKQNLLQQNFKADHPNQIWVSDITCFKVNGYWLYFCVILDLYSRKVIDWKVARNDSTQLVTSTFKSTYENRGQPKELIFHSDRGVQYTSAAFSKLLQKHHMKQSFSASGRPHDNAVAETFFATFKKEEAYRRDYSSEQSFRKSVEQFVAFYNDVRPHRALAYKTPHRYEALYYGHEKAAI